MFVCFYKNLYFAEINFPVFFLILFPKRILFPVYVFLQRFLFSYYYYFSFVPMCNLWPCKCMGAVWFKRHWKVFPWSNRNWSLPSSREMCFDALKIKMEIMLSKNVLKLWNLPVFSSSLNHLEARYVKILYWYEILQLYTTCSKIIKRINWDTIPRYNHITVLWSLILWNGMSQRYWLMTRDSESPYWCVISFI